MSQDTSAARSDGPTLLTGATGYVGGRLLRALEASGVWVRCLARRPESLQRRVAPATEIVLGDVSDSGSLTEALRGARNAYYLIHSMGANGDFQQQDRAGAQNFARAAASISSVISSSGVWFSK